MEPVVLRGFLLSVSSPSDSHLVVSYDTSRLGWDRYRDLVYKLSDLLAEIDEAYKLRRLRGRGVHARHRRLVEAGGQVRRLKVLRFSPYPSRFSNALSALRIKLYEEVNRRCVALQYAQSGGYKEVLYLLPYEEAPHLLKAVEEMNGEIGRLRGEVEAFKETEYAKRVVDLLERVYGERLDPYREPSQIPEIRLRMLPVQVEPRILEEHVDERVRRQLEEQRRELAERALEHFRQRVESLVSRVLRAERLERVKTELEELGRLAEEVGLRALASSVIDPLRAIAEEPKRVGEIIRECFQVEPSELEKGVNYRISALLKAL